MANLEYKTPNHRLNEIFSKELPSRYCTSHINIQSDILGDTEVDESIRLATECHSLSLSRRVKDIGDGYALSSKKLPSSFKASQRSQLKQTRENQRAESSIFSDGDTLTCIAHSFICLGSKQDDALANIEVFAISREHQALPFNPTSPTNNNSKPSHAKTKSETSISGLSLSDSVKEDVASNVPEDVHRMTVSCQLLIKTRYSVQSNASFDKEAINDATKHDTRAKQHKTMTEIVSLDFRPSIVHLRELSITSDSIESRDTMRIPTIGIYVASSDDNRLRLYCATRKSLTERYDGGHHSVNTTCFSLTSLSIDRANQDELDENPGDNFVFNSSITALDTLGEDKLAVALFDGTIHIMSYLLKHTGSLGCIKCQVQCSTFFVDGPVITLHFGVLNLEDICSRTNQQPVSNVFLVAGSLCGFACVLYEKTDWQTSESAAPSYGGPLPIVDELYDPSHGNEDCVTSVHTCCSNTANPMIAIGTQRGRILLFQRTTDKKYAFDETAFVREAKSKQEYLASKAAEIKSEIDSVRSYKETLQMEPEGLETSIIELNSEFDLLQTNELSNEMLGVTEYDDQSEEFIGDVHIEPFLLLSRIQSLESELSEIRDKITTTEAKIVNLESSLQSVVAELQNSRNATSTALQLSLAKMHRYELVCKHDLPYPIHGLHFHLGDLIVFTRRTIHLFYKPWSSSAFVEKRLALFEKKLAAMLKI